MPRDNVLPSLEEVHTLLPQCRYPNGIEVRLTPNDRSQALLGPGVGRPTTDAELAPSMSRDTDAVFRAFEGIVLPGGQDADAGRTPKEPANEPLS